MEEKVEVKCGQCGRILLVPKEYADSKWLCAGCALIEENTPEGM